jgi:hypothetical protein
MTPPLPRRGLRIAAACAAASLAHGCQVDLEPSPCDRTEPYVTVPEPDAGSGPVLCGTGDPAGACLFVTTDDPAGGVAVASGRLYYTVPSQGGAQTSGTVASVSVDGPANQPPDTLVYPSEGPNAIAARGNIFAWVTGQNSKLWLGPGNPEGANSWGNLAKGCVAFDADRLYFAHDPAGRIASVLAVGDQVSGQKCCDGADDQTCKPTTCSAGVNVVVDHRIGLRGTTALDGSIYWIEAGTLRRIHSDGSGEEPLAQVSEAAGCMAAWSDLLFYSDRPSGEIWAYSLVGGCRVPIVAGIHTSPDAEVSVALDDHYLYWSSADGIWRMPRPF